MKAESKIIVAIRKRPLLKRDEAKKDVDIITVRPPCDLTLKEQRFKVDLTPFIEEHKFSFDYVFDENSDNEYIYDLLLKPLVASVFSKAKINVFAYGQTGSGKTFTMMGNAQAETPQLNAPVIPGLYLMAAEDVFALLPNYPELDQGAGISFYEIYCGKAYDLLNGRECCPIRVDHKDNVNIVGLAEKRVANTESLMALIRYGLSVRVTSTTGMNDESSRSHAILSISLRDSSNGKVAGKLSFIDLAGSERGADVTDTNKQTRLDGAEINKSLLALKECIRALDMDKKYLPFRGSKLTMVLKDSFMGNSVTVMIGNISPVLSSCEHSLNTLRYADRVKELKKDKNERERDVKDALARQLMLPRMNKNSARMTMPERTVEASLVFENFDVNQNNSMKMLPNSKNEKVLKRQTTSPFEIGVRTNSVQKVVSGTLSRQSSVAKDGFGVDKNPHLNRYSSVTNKDLVRGPLF